MSIRILISALLLISCSCLQAGSGTALYNGPSFTPEIPDTIPFSIGIDHGIHLSIRVNGSDTLDFLFDTGANGSVLTEDARERLGIVPDGTTSNRGVDGVSTKQTSSGNILDIGGLRLSNITLVIIDYARPNFDGVLGWVVFRDKIIEIDYESQLMILHDRLDKVPGNYIQVPMQLRENRPFMKATLNAKGKPVSAWFLYDTGSSGTLGLTQRFARTNDLNKGMKKIRTAKASGSAGRPFNIDVVELPQLKIDQFSFKEIPISINQVDPNGSPQYGILGNRLMKRFNLILDPDKRQYYLKPNKLMDMPYLSKKR